MKKRKLYFRCLKKIMKLKYKKPKFIYLGEEIQKGAIILSNHEGTDAPMALEIYHPLNMRMWGAYEMNSGLVNMYRYQTKVYYHEKKHWNIHLARLFCLIASPLTNLFYKGFNLISTYKDARLLKTIKESKEAISNNQTIVIFPEDSTNGYLPELEAFHEGFVILCKACYKQGIDIPIYVSYYQKSTNTYIFDTPVYYSQLEKQNLSRKEIASILVRRCNELGKMNFTENNSKAA